MPPKSSAAAAAQAAEPEATQEQAALARQLARDMESLRKRRQQLEHEIKVRDLAVFALETDYLNMTSTPMCASTDPLFSHATAAGQARGRDGRPVTAATPVTAQQQRPMPATQQQQQQQQNVHHLGALRLGETVSDARIPRGIAIHDRAFSLSNFTALATCGKHGMLDQA